MYFILFCILSGGSLFLYASISSWIDDTKRQITRENYYKKYDVNIDVENRTLKVLGHSSIYLINIVSFEVVDTVVNRSVIIKLKPYDKPPVKIDFQKNFGSNKSEADNFIKALNQALDWVRNNTPKSIIDGKIEKPGTF